MAKLTLQDILSGYSSLAKLNANFAAIEAIFERVVFRDGTAPNTMTAQLDMNSNRITNLASPFASTDAARWIDVTEGLALTGTAVPALTGNAGKRLSTDGTVLRWGDPYFDRTQAEIDAGVVPVELAYPPGNVKRYGAVGDGVTNDRDAFQRALTVGGSITAPAGLTILIGSAMTCTVAKTSVDLGGSVLKYSATFDDAGTNNLIMISITAEDVVIRNAVFDASAKSAESNRNVFLQYNNNSHRGGVHHCRFISLPTGGSDINVAIAFLNVADDGEVDSCSFHACPGAAFAQGARPRFINCLATAPTDVSFGLNGVNCVGGSVIGCKVYANNISVGGAIQAEEGASDWVFANNYVFGVKDGFGIAETRAAVTTVVSGGVIANNVIDGGSFQSTAPSTLIGTTIYSRGCRIVNNILRGMPGGIAGNSAIAVGALHTLIDGNRVDATAGDSAAAAIIVTPAGGPIDIFDNHIDCTGGPGNHVVFGSGDNGSQRAFFRGGSFIGGTSAINTNNNDPTNFPIWFENITQNTAANFIDLTEVTSLETFFNTNGAISHPHSIKTKRFCYGLAAPTQGAWLSGDTVFAAAPAASAPAGWVCTADGTPGTWKAMANLAA